MANVDLDAVRAMMEGEPVAWRVRVRGDDPEEWVLLRAGGGADYLERPGYECQPLYDSTARELVTALTAEVEANRATIAGLTAERDRLLAERPYIVGANDGWDAAVEQGETSEAVKSAMVRFWKRLAEIHLARAEKAEATIAGLTAEVAHLQWQADSDDKLVAEYRATIAGLEARVEALTDGARTLPIDRETLGRMVREAWVRWAQAQPNPKASWLAPYDDLAEPDKEADRQIGEAIARWTLIHDAARAVLSGGTPDAVV